MISLSKFISPISLVMIIVPAPLHAENWVRVVNMNYEIGYLDLSSIKRSQTERSNLASAAIKFIKKDTSNPIKSETVVYVYDCNNNKDVVYRRYFVYRDGKVENQTNPDLEGSLRNNKDRYSKGTFGQFIFNYVCGYSNEYIFN